MIKKIAILVVLLGTLSCSTIDIHIKKGSIKSKPATILIGNFESRNLSYDPFVIKNFRDFLSYDFFKLGYNSKLIPVRLKTITEQNKTEVDKLTAGLSSYVFIEGTISQNVYGDPIDSDISTSLVITIYNNRKEKSGEVIYLLNHNLSNSKLLKSISTKVAETISREISSN